MMQILVCKVLLAFHSSLPGPSDIDTRDTKNQAWSVEADAIALDIRACTVTNSSNLNTLMVSSQIRECRDIADQAGRIRYANNSNYRNDSLIRKESA